MLVDYAERHGVPLPVLLRGIDTPLELLTDKLEWTDAPTWTRMIGNIIEHGGEKKTTAYDIGCELASDFESFQFLFLRTAPVAFMVETINRHVRNFFDRNLDIQVKVKEGKEAIVSVRPIDPSTYTVSTCNFIRGVAVTLLNLKGYKGVVLSEERCAARDKSAECRYIITWNSRPGMYRKMLEFFNRCRHYGAIIDYVDRNQNALQEQFLFLQALLETIPNPIFCKDTNGRFIQCNAAYEEYIEQPKSLIIGKTAHEFISREIAEISENRDAEVLSSGKTLVYETTSERKDGTVRHTMLHKAPFRRGDGTIAGIVGILTDLSQQREEEEARGRLEKSLMQAQKMEALGNLAGRIAHDFNNILGAIIGHSELAMHNLPAEHPARHSMKQVLKAGDRASHLVSQILSFSRRDDPERKPLSLGPVIDEIIELLKATLPSNIEIRRQFGQKSRPVMADPTQVHQLLMNLCTNSAHAMSAKGGWLEVALDDVCIDGDTAGISPGQAHGYYERITVRDTGHGMDKITLGRIFEPYFTTKGPGRGTGLGLSVVHGIVESHGGFVSVRSEPEKGTTFQVFLPALPRSEVEQQCEEFPSVPEGTERVLLVDDEPTLVDVVQHMLSKYGYRITALTSSTDALDLFRCNPDAFDLVITDMTMPVVMGDELAREIHRIRQEIPVILVTGFNERITPEMLAEAGIGRLRMKPLNMREIARDIRDLIDKKNPAA